MLKLLIFYITISCISSELILTIFPQEKIVMNADEGGKIPLIVKPSEDVDEDIEFTCNSNIRYNFWNTTFGYDVFDEETLPKIPAGTKAGTEIKFNCILIKPVYNEIITLDIEDTFLFFDVPSDKLIYLQNLKWKDDENNNKIEYVPKFSVVPSYSTSKNLEKNNEIYLDITLMENIGNEISIVDETFILNKERSDILINLISCSKIPKNSQKGNIKISCLVEKEAKDGKFLLKLGQGKKIDNIEPKVSGYITFSAQGEDSTNFAKIIKISLIIFILLF